MAEKDTNLSQEDQALKDWEEMLKSENGNKSLDQSEIDNILGVKEAEDPNANKGITAVLAKAEQVYDNLPMLTIIFERFVRSLTTSLRNLILEPVEINITKQEALRFGVYLNTIPLPTVITVFKALEWENYGLMIIDNHLLFNLMDILFGGKNSSIPVKVEGRAYTNIEQALVRQISDVILNELGAGFDFLTPITFSSTSIETNPNLVSITRPGSPVVLLQIDVSINGKSGKVDIVLPYPTLEPVKDLLTHVFMGEKFGVDNEWEENLTTAIYDIDAPLTVVIVDKPTTLKKVAKLKVGDTIILAHKQEEDVTMKWGEVDVFKGRVGRVQEKVAFSVNKVLPNNEEE